jgi:AhpD family alkylhydroperoxidase
MTTTTDLTDHHDHLAEHAPRLDWIALVPDVYKAMIRLDTAAKAGLDGRLVDLVKVRASQLNHCAFCLDMHSKDALAAGESTDRLLQLSAWSESRHFYTAREVAAIELTEAITVLTDGFVPDDVYARAAARFDDTELAQLIAVVTAINAFNRLGVSTRMVPGHYTPTPTPGA